jgi:Flp pilus assembly protein TadD
MESDESAQRRLLHTPAAVAIVSASALLALSVLADADAWRGTALAASALLLLFALYQTLRFYRRSLRSHVTAALILASGIFAFTQWGNGFYGFLDPSRFRVLDETRSVAGRLSLLQSRDYDDPFFALLWRSKQSLTQSSRLVQSGLYRMAHIPMLLASERADVLVLGLGSALPVHGILMHEPASVTCVEPFAPTISLAAATRHSGRARPWLQSVTFHAERIGSFVRRSDRRYDVIIGAEPFATPGTPASMLTRSTIEHTAGLLTSDGLYAQWLPVSRVGVEGVRSVAAAMGEVFPHIELWISGPDPENAMAGIIGFATRPPVGIPSPERLAVLLSSQEGAFHFRGIEIDRWADLAVCWSMSDQTVRAFSAGAATPSMFSPLRTRDPEQDEARVWTDVRTLLTARSGMRQFPRAAPDSLLSDVEKMYDDRIAILDARVLALQGDDQQAVSVLSDVLRRFQGNTEARHGFAGIMLRQAAGYVGEEQYGPALQLLNTAMALVPLNTYLLRLLMIAGFQTGDREAAGLSIDGLKRLDPLHAGYRDNQATIRAQQGATNDALLLYESAITVDPYNEEIYCNMASFHFSQQRTWEAVRVLDEATTRAWYPARALYLQGLFYAEQGRFDFARESWEQYLRIATPIDPWLTEVENRLRALPPRK